MFIKQKVENGKFEPQQDLPTPPPPPFPGG